METLPQTTITRSAAETRAWAASIPKVFSPGTVLALHGELGAGKTCLVQGLAEALGVRDIVNSPTYTLVNEYAGRQQLYHIDLYRLASSSEAFAAGLEEYLQPDGYTAIEWAERVADSLPEHTVHITLEPGAERDERLITVKASSAS